MGMIVLISPNFLSSKAVTAMVEALSDMDVVVRHTLQKASQENWEILEEDNPLPVTFIKHIVLTQINEPAFRLILYE